MSALPARATPDSQRPTRLHHRNSVHTKIQQRRLDHNTWYRHQPGSGNIGHHLETTAERHSKNRCELVHRHRQIAHPVRHKRVSMKPVRDPRRKHRGIPNSSELPGKTVTAQSANRQLNHLYRSNHRREDMPQVVHKTINVGRRNGPGSGNCHLTIMPTSKTRINTPKYMSTATHTWCWAGTTTAGPDPIQNLTPPCITWSTTRALDASWLSPSPTRRDDGWCSSRLRDAAATGGHARKSLPPRQQHRETQRDTTNRSRDTGRARDRNEPAKRK